MTTGVRWAVRLVAVALLLAATLTSRADEKNPLREELLKLNSVTGEEAQQKKLRALIKDREKAKQLVAEAGKMLKEPKGKENFKYNGALIVARMAHIVKQYDVAEPLYEHLVETATKLKSGEKMIAAYEGLIDLHFDNKKYATAAEVCEKCFDAAGPDEFEAAKPFILERLVQARAKEEKFEEALRLADQLVEADKGGWYFLQTKGWVLREQGKLGAAIDAYKESLDRLDGNKQMPAELKNKMKDRTRYTLTGLYVDNKEVDKAAKELQTLIKRNPDNATYKNDLGFIWCDNDLNLEESEKLIKEAIELDTKEKEAAKKEGKIDDIEPNAAYLDSLGWVYFKQKKYKEALEQLKLAVKDEDDGAHLEIWDHLADVHMALGQKKEAIDAWKKGLTFDDLSKRDAERRKKVVEKLKKEGVDVPLPKPKRKVD